MKKLDVLIVGAGMAGIACGMRLLDKGNHNFMICDRGRSYDKRYCAVDYGKKCAECDGICNVISGFGGCIHYGDSVKLSTYPSGKRLYELLGAEKYQMCLEFVKNALFQNHRVEFEMTEARKITTMDVKDYGICSLNSEQVKKSLQNWFFYLQANQNILMETRVKDVEKREEDFYVTLQRKGGEETVCAKKVVIAIGRDGIEWWKEMIRQLGVEAELPIISLGFRFELNKKYLVSIGKIHPDLKLRFTKEERKFKTFCFCAGAHGGKLKCERYEDFTLLDGHLLTESDEESEFANFAILMQLAKGDGQATYVQVHSKYIVPYKKLGGNSGLPIYQNYYSFKKKKEKSEGEKTSLANAKLASVWKLLDAEEHALFCEVADEIFHWIMERNGMAQDNIDEFEKGIHILGIEIESLWDSIHLDKSMMTTVNGLYAIGDCTGLAQGIIPAAISGVYVANQM